MKGIYSKTYLSRCEFDGSMEFERRIAGILKPEGEIRMLEEGSISALKILLVIFHLFLAGTFFIDGYWMTAHAVPVTDRVLSLAQKPVDLNTATAEELDSLPGVGMKTASKIIAMREQKGGFVSIEELVEVSGIGPKKFEKLRPLVSVGRSTSPEEITENYCIALLDINRAGVEELEKLSGIGRTLAKRICDWREINGPFRKKEELMNVPGIGRDKFQKIRELIFVKGE